MEFTRRRTTKAIGDEGEALALAHLQRAGLVLVERNYRVARGPHARGALVHARAELGPGRVRAQDGEHRLDLCFVVDTAGVVDPLHGLPLGSVANYMIKS